MKKLSIVAVAIALVSTPALALDAHYAKSTSASPAEAWKAIGDFCGISAWHPALEKCEQMQKDGATLRKLHLKGGGTILEKLVEQNNETMTQTYVILEGVLPVTNYSATLKVVPTGSGAKFDWSGAFDAKDGVEDAESVKVMTGVYTAGIDALVDKTSN